MECEKNDFIENAMNKDEWLTLKKYGRIIENEKSKTQS